MQVHFYDREGRELTEHPLNGSWCVAQGPCLRTYPRAGQAQQWRFVRSWLQVLGGKANRSGPDVPVLSVTAKDFSTPVRVRYVLPAPSHEIVDWFWLVPADSTESQLLALGPAKPRSR